MREVAIIGVGMTNFGKITDSLVEMGVQAAEKAINDCNVEKNQIEALFLGNFVGEVLTGQALLAALIARGLGIRGIPVTKVEGACASGGIALRQAILTVASGQADVAMAVGAEKMTASPTEKVTGALAGALDQQLDGRSGLTFPGFFGLVAQRYQAEFHSDMEAVAHVVVKSRANAGTNPVCYLRKQVSVEEVRGSYPVAEPLRLMDCCPISDGAAAAVVCSVDMAKKLSGQPVKVLASVQTSGAPRISDVSSLLSFEATTQAAKLAYNQAGITAKDVDVVELHDCFSIAEVVDSEDLGFFKKGEGAEAVKAGLTAVDGDIPINPSGGLISRGHPVGATGLAQVYEIVRQLQGKAVNQVRNARMGLAHNLGGTGATCTVTILTNDL